MAKQVKYTDIRPISFPAGTLKHYPKGISFPNDDNLLTVEDSELKSILKKKNCNKSVFELVRKKVDRVREESDNESEE